MLRQTLIVRKMRREWRFEVARRNLVATGRWNPFDRWTHGSNETEDEKMVADEAATFLRNNPYAYIVGCQLDIGGRVYRAWSGAYLIARALGKSTLKPSHICATPLGRLRKILAANRMGNYRLSHDVAARRIKEAARLLYSRYGDRVERLWTEPTTLDDLKARLKLPGLGPQLGNMAIKFMVAFGMIPQIRKTKKMLSELDPKADSNLILVFFRTGLSKAQTAGAAINAARVWAPDCPVSLDQAGFSIGNRWCSVGNCDDCPLALHNGKRLCPRRLRVLHLQ